MKIQQEVIILMPPFFLCETVFVRPHRDQEKRNAEKKVYVNFVGNGLLCSSLPPS